MPTSYHTDHPEYDNLQFGHQQIADWLVSQLKEKIAPPFRLALTGSFGSGKSTIILKALEQLKQDKDEEVNWAYVDLWKLDKESTRRSAILKIAKDLKVNPRTIDELNEKLYGFSTDYSKIKSISYALDWPSIIVAFLAVIILYFLLGAISTLGEGPKIAIALAVAAFNLIFRFLDKSLIILKRTVVKHPIVGAEEFEECLQTILEKVKSDSKVIIVFDNLDRAPLDISHAILNGISTFFDHSHGDRIRNLIIIVPFDMTSGKLISKDNIDINYEENTEIAFKMFDAVIPLPKIIEEDLFDYTVLHLKTTISEFCDEKKIEDVATLIR